MDLSKEINNIVLIKPKLINLFVQYSKLSFNQILKLCDNYKHIDRVIKQLIDTEIIIHYPHLNLYYLNIIK